jgi:flagellar hook-associated protein 2
VGTGISFSGFSGIDFSVIVNAVMAQERQPLTALQTQQTALKTRTDQLQTLATRLGAVESASRALSSQMGLSAFAATSSDAATLAASAGTGAQAGRYEIEVTTLARAQVTVSGTVSDPTAEIATGGALRIGSTDVTLTGSTSLNGLATAINARTDLGVRATVIQSGSSAYRLVLTATQTGTAGAFTLEDLTSGGSGLGFLDTDGDGIVGDSAADNAAAAQNAELRINNVPVSSSSNTVTAIPGVALTLNKATTAPVTVDIAADPASARTKMQALVTAYNELIDFMNAQVASAQRNEAASLGREPVLRQARSMLRTMLQSTQTTSAVYTSASQLGLEFTSSGKLQLDTAAFDKAVTTHPAEVQQLFRGNGTTTGVFTQVANGLTAFTDGAGVIKTLRTTLADRSTRLSRQIVTLEGRLNQRRLALQQEFTAAEQAMSRLQSQSGAIANFKAAQA